MELLLPLICFLYFWPFLCLIFNGSTAVTWKAILYSVMATLFLMVVIKTDFSFYVHCSRINIINTYFVVKALCLMFSAAVIIFSYYKRSALINGIGFVLLLSATNPANLIWCLYTTMPAPLFLSIMIIGILLFIAGIILKIIEKKGILSEAFSGNFLAASYSILLVPASFIFFMIIQSVFGVIDSILGKTFNLFNLSLGLSALLIMLVYVKVFITYGKAFMGKKQGRS